MPSYTTSLRLLQPSTGEYSGTWGTEINNSMTALVDAAVAGTTTVTMTAANVTLTNANGVADQAKSMFLVLSGTPGGSYQVIVPTASKLYFVTNSTGSAQTVKTASGSGISVPNGARMTLRCDGTDVVVAQNYFASLTLGAALPVASGGTGVTTSTGTGAVVLSTSPTFVTPILGTPTSVTLTNGTGLPLTTGVTGTLPVANGGTGVTTSTGSGNNVLSTSPTLVTPILGTPTSVTLTNGTGLPLTTGITGTLPVANGGTGITSFTSGGVVYASSTSALATGSGLVFDGSNLGIGTSSPATTLHVQSATGQARIQNTTSGTALIGFRNSATTDVPWVGTGGDDLRFTALSTERMRLDSSGNLGLGVTPSAWSGVIAMQLQTGASLTGFSNTTNLVQNAYYNGSWRYISTAAAALSQVTQGAHQWFTAPSGTAGNAISFTQAMTLTNDGKLGIGTSSPSYRLDIVGPANTPHISSYDGNVQSVAAYPDGSGASARNYVGTLSNHDNVFLTNNVERGRFTTGGDFCVGATTVSGIGITLFNNGGPGFSLVNNNNAAATGYVFSSFRRSGVEIGSVTQNGTTAVLFNTTSDRRLKDNITPAPSASDVIDAIEIVSHDWKSAPDEHVTYGVIAQDLALVAPQAVLQGDDGDEIEKTWGVDYSKLVPLLIKEIQSLRARVAALEQA